MTVRIISPFHDYYDTAQGLGYDPTLIYRREVVEKVVPLERFDSRVLELYSNLRLRWEIKATLVVLGFCGRLYPSFLKPGFKVELESVTSRSVSNPVMTREELNAHYDEVRYPGRETKWSRVAFARLCNVMEQQGVSASMDTFRALGAPIWLAEPCDWAWDKPFSLRIYTNIRLANFDFQKHFDAYTAYQEIAMFLGSALATTDDSARTVGSDEVIARAKGFGPESFRSSAPSVKKSRRKENRARKKGEG